MSVEHIVTGAPTTHEIVVYVDGVATNLDAAPTYAITDADGAAVASGTATTTGTGVYSITIAAPTEVAQWTVAWSGLLSGSAWSAATSVEVLGGSLFTINELRTFRGGDLVSTVNFPNADIIDARAAITDEFTDIIGVSPVPRYHRETVPGSGTATLNVTRGRVTSVIACTVSGTTVTASNFDTHPFLPIIYRTNGSFNSASTVNPRNVTIGYRYGYETVPADLRRAGIILARQRLISDLQGQGIPDQASSWTDTSGTFQAFAASMKSDRWYGLPAVDIPLARHRTANNIPIGG